MLDQTISEKNSTAALVPVPNPQVCWRVAKVEAQADLSLQVRFLDGLVGEVAFESSFLSGVFDKLKDPDYFRKVGVEYGAVAWPDGPDLAPDAMYDAIKTSGIWILR